MVAMVAGDGLGRNGRDRKDSESGKAQDQIAKVHWLSPLLSPGLLVEAPTLNRGYRSISDAR